MQLTHEKAFVIMSMSDTIVEDVNGAQHALQIAFQTMQERCQQLQKRLAAVEEENLSLRVQQGIETSDISRDNEKIGVLSLQKRVEELTKQKSQLTHHVFMVAAENRQLWSRLTRLMRTNKNLGNQLIKISDTLKQHPTQNVDALTHSFKNVATDLKNESNKAGVQAAESGSMEEISFRLINSIMMEKSELEQQCTEMLEMQNGADINLENVGFTYPEVHNTDSLQQLKQHDVRLSQTKDILVNQQVRLKRAIRSLKKLKKGTTCKNCRETANKTMCQIGTQFDSDDSLKENGATQTSIPPSTIPVPETQMTDSNRLVTKSRQQQAAVAEICPLCGDYFAETVDFQSFHEHVLSHFTKPIDSF